MNRQKSKRYIVGTMILLIIIAIFGIVKISNIDFNAGKVKVAKAYLDKMTSKLSANIYSATEDNQLVSGGYDEVNYVVKYSLTKEEGLTERPVKIKASLSSSEEYAIFKNIEEEGVTSVLSDDGKTIEITVNNASTENENTLVVKMIVNGAPNGYKITPTIEIKEVSQENYNTVIVKELEVNTKSITGIVRDNNNAIVSDILVSLVQNGEVIKETYSKSDGSYVFSDLESGKYKIEVNEEIYEQVGVDEVTIENTATYNISVKKVEPFKIETHKYITKLNLVNNGVTYTYNYGELETVQQSVRQLKNLNGEVFYKVTIENIGKKDGIVTVVKDEMPEGLSFTKSKNVGWEEKNGVLYNRTLEGLTIKKGEKKELPLVLDIDNTNSGRTYLNKITAYGDIYEKVVYILDNEVYREVEVLEGEKVKDLKVSGGNFDGWFTDKNYTNKYNFNNQVTKDMILYGKLQNEYKVDYYDQTEDDYQLIKTIKVKHNEKATGAPTVTRQYYTFKHWSLEKNGSAYDFNTKVTSNISLYAVYDRNMANVSFYDVDPDGVEEPTLIEEQLVAEGTTAVEPENIPEHYGYTFECFETETGEEWNFNNIIEEDLVLRTCYSKNKYNVEYYHNDSLVRKDEYQYKDIIDSANTPVVTKEGHTFLYWSLKNATSGYDFTLPVTKNIKLYSNFEINKNDVIFNDENRVTTVEVNYGSTVSPIENQGKTGHTFKYWSVDRTNAFNFNTPITESTTVYAVYEKNTYTVTFNDKNPSTNEITPYTTKNVLYGDTVSIDTNPTHDGYTFKNWLNGEQIFDFDTPITGNITLVSNYDIIRYDIHYELHDGELETGKTNPSKYTIEDEFTLNNPSIEGYEFTGWTGTGLNELTKTVTVSRGSTGERNYEAHYQKLTYTVRFIHDGRQFVNDQEVEHGEKATQPSEDPDESENHQIFKYWSIEENGTAYDFNTPITKNTTLYSVLETVIEPKISHTPTTWTNQNVTVTVAKSDSLENDTGYSYRYKVGTDEYKNYTTPFEVEENGTVVAYSIKGNTESVITTHEITNIDKVPPTIDEAFVDTCVDNGFVLAFIASDDLSGVNKVKVYIKNNTTGTDYEYLSDVIYDEGATVMSYQFDDLVVGNNYTVKLVAVDNAGNQSEAYEFYDHTVEYCGDIVARIISINGTDLDPSNYINYDSLRGAIEDENCVSNSCTIQMVKGTNESVEVLNGQNITLDINGKTISGIRDDYTIQNSGILTVLDNGIDTGVIVNPTGIAINGISNSTFTLGDTSAELSKSKPYIYGKTYGIYNANDADFYFYDGKIEGKIAIQGLVTDTRYAHNVYNSSRSGNQIATLSKVSDPEAKIEGYYYARLTGAIADSEEGTSIDDSEVVMPLLDSFDTMGTYGFEYKEETDTLESTNNIIGTTARTSLVIDLTGYENNQLLSIAYMVEGAGSPIIEVKEEDNYGDEVKKFYPPKTELEPEGQTTIDYILPAGKKYYVEISYVAKRKPDEDVNSNLTTSKAIITKATLTAYDSSSNDKYSESVSSNIKYYSFDYDSETGYLKSNNQYVPYSFAYKSIEIDLTKEFGKKDVVVDAYVDSYGSYYAYVVLNEEDKPLFDMYSYYNYYYSYAQKYEIGYLYNTNGQPYATFGPYNFSKTVDPGKKYYLQFYFINTYNTPSRESYIENNSTNQFVIKSINVFDHIDEVNVYDKLQTSSCSSTSKYYIADLRNETEDKTLKAVLYGPGNAFIYSSDSYMSNICLQTPPPSNDVEIIANTTGNESTTYLGSNGTSDASYFSGTLKAGKYNYIILNNINISYSELMISDEQKLDLSKITTAEGVGYTNAPMGNSVYPFYYLDNPQNNSFNDSYIKIDLTNETSDKLLKVNARFNNGSISYMYLSNSAEATPYSNVDSNPKMALMKVHSEKTSSVNYYSWDSYYKYPYYQLNDYFNDYRYRLEKGHVYYLHFASNMKYGSGYSNATIINNITLSSIGGKYDPNKINEELITSEDATQTTIVDIVDQEDNSFRYIGKDPDNYVSFNGETWRIVGVFETEDENGNKANRLKIVRDEFLGTGIYDSTRNYDNNGSGYINEWSLASLMKLLNPGYENETGGSLYYNKSSGTYDNNSVDFTSNGLPETLKPLIDEVKWNTGAVPSSVNPGGLDYDTLYNYERGNLGGKETDPSRMTGQEDYVERTTSWVGKVGLPYITDTLYAAGDYYIESSDTTISRSDCISQKNSSCIASASWIHVYSPLWSMTPYTASSNYVLFNAVTVNSMPSGQSANIKPTVYLSTKTIIGGGDGSQSNPFTLSLGSSVNPDTDYGLVEKNDSNFIEDHGYRYTGSNPNNYVSVDGELWRIIGVFEVEDANGNKANRIKLIRSDSLGNYRWDTKQYQNQTNYGNGINEWSQADLMMLLNPGYEDNKDLLFRDEQVTHDYGNGNVYTYTETKFDGYKNVNNSLYWNRSSGNCTNSSYNRYGTCDYTSNGLTEESRNMIDKVKWYTGSFNNEGYTNLSVHDLYNLERSNNTGKDNMPPNSSLSDNVERTTSWYGYVGLLYPSDIYMASDDDNEVSHYSREKCLSKIDYAHGCIHAGYTNWLGNYRGMPFWTLNPTNNYEYYSSSTSSYEYSYVPFYVTSYGGNINNQYDAGTYYIKPTVYLSTKTYIKSGKGTKTSPYVFELGDVDNPDEYYGLFTNYSEVNDELDDESLKAKDDETYITYGFDYNEETNIYTSNNSELNSVAIKTIKYDLTAAIKPAIKSITIGIDGIRDGNNGNYYTYSSAHYFMFEDENPSISYLNTYYSSVCQKNLGDEKCSEMYANNRRYNDYYLDGNNNKTFLVTLEPGHVYYLQMAFVKNTDATMTFNIQDLDTENETTSFDKYTVVNTLNDDYDKIVLLKNISVTEPIVIEGDRKVTIDLNGYNINNTSSSEESVIKNYGDLTIINTKDNYDITLNKVTNELGGKLTLNDVDVSEIDNIGEFTGDSESTVTRFNNIETGNILDGESTFTTLTLKSDSEDSFSGYKVTEKLVVEDGIAKIDSLNKNTSHTPIIKVDKTGVLTLTNSITGDIVNNGEINLDSINSTNYYSSYNSSSAGPNATSNINNLTLSGTMILGEIEEEYKYKDRGRVTHTINNSTIPTLEANSCVNMDNNQINNATFESYSSYEKCHTTIKNSNIATLATINNGDIHIDESTINNVSIVNGSFESNNSIINNGITQNTVRQYDGTSYYFDKVNIDLDTVSVGNDITLYVSDGEINSTTAKNLYFSDGEMEVNNSSFNNVKNRSFRTSASKSCKVWISMWNYYNGTCYYYYTTRGGVLTLNDLTLNNGYITNENTTIINNATINKGTDSSTAAITNNRSYYWDAADESHTSGAREYRYEYSTSGHIEPNLTIKGNVEINGYDIAVQGAYNVGSLTLGDKDDLNDTNLVVNGNSIGYMNSSYQGQDLNFYDGKLVGQIPSGSTLGAINGPKRINDIENGYDIRIYNENNNEIIELVKISDITTGAVARIGNTDYPTLTAAFNAVQDNELTEITLLEDITTAAKIVVPENKNIRFNYNGHKIDFIGSYSFIENNGSLYVYDDSGSPKMSNTWSKSLFLNNGTFVYNDIKYNGYSTTEYTSADSYDSAYKKYATKIIVNNSNVTINSGTITGGTFKGIINNNENGILVINNGNINTVYNDGNLEVHGGTFNSRVADTYNDILFYNNGTATIEGGNYDTNDIVLFIKNNGLANISSVTHTGNKFAESSGGKMILSNNTISGIISSKDELIINSGTHTNTIYSTGTLTINDIDLNTGSKDAIMGNTVIFNGSTENGENTKINIIGGTIKSTSRAIVCPTNTCYTTVGIKGDIDDQGNQIVSKTNPSITGDTFVYVPAMAESKFYFYDGILKGSFNASFDEIEENYDLINPEGTQTRYLDKIPVMENTTTHATYYNIKKAIDEVGTDETLKLLRNFVKIETVPTFVVDETKKFTIDLNGNDIVGGENASNLIFDNRGNLTLTSSISGSELGAVKNSGTIGIYNVEFNDIIGTVINNTGTANINGVTINVPSGGDAEPTIDCRTYAIPLVNDGNMEFGNSTINSGLGCQLIDNNNVLSLNGVTVTQEYGNKYYNWIDYGNKTKPSDVTKYGISKSLITNDGTLTINSGTYTRKADRSSTSSVEKLYENYNFDHELIYSNGTLNINGGTFTIPQDKFVTSVGSAVINGVDVTNDKDVFTYSGELRVNGATVNTNSAVFNAIEDSNLYINGGSYTTSGKRVYELYVDSRTYYNPYTYYSALSIQKGGNVEVNGGEFTNNGTSNQAVFLGNVGTSSILIKSANITNNTKGSAIANVTNVTLGVKDGNVSNNSVSLTTNENVIYEAYNIKFYDGTLTGNGEYLVISNTATKNTTIETETGYSIIGTGNTLYVGTDDIVTNLRTNTPYTDVQTAVDEAESGDTLQFNMNVYMTSTLNIGSNKNVTLDLNGKIVQKVIENNGTLEIIDSTRSDGNGSYNITTSYKGSIERINNKGTLNVNSGRVNLIYNYSSSIATVNKAYVYNTWNYGTMELNNSSNYVFYNYTGTVSLVNPTITTLNNQSGSTITINSGTISRFNNNVGTAIINGGTFSNSDTSSFAIYNGTTEMASITTAIMTINGGTIAGTKGIENHGTLNIAGGTYTAETMLNNEYIVDNNHSVSNYAIANITNYILNTSSRIENSGVLNFNNSTYNNTNSYGINCRSVYDSDKGRYYESCGKGGTINATYSNISSINSNYLYADNSTLGNVNSINIEIEDSTVNHISSSTNIYKLTGNTVNGNVSYSYVKGPVSNNIFNGTVEFDSIENNNIVNNTFNETTKFRNIKKNIIGNTFNKALDVHSIINDILMQNNIINSMLNINYNITNSSSGRKVTLDGNNIYGTVSIDGDVTMISGTIDTTDEFAVIVKNDSTFTMGSDDATVDTVSPSVKGQKGINNLGTFNFYDGVIITDLTNIPVIGSTNTPEGYTINSVNYSEENVTKSTLGVQGQEEARIVVVNKINFESIHDAIAYSAANGGLDAVLYADVTLESDLLVEEDVTIKIILNGHNVLNPSGYTISEKITLSGEVVDDSSVGGAIYKFFASITGNETTKDVVLYQMDDGSKLSPEKIYTLYKYENGNYNIVKTEREEELGRYTIGNSSTDMRTVRSRIYLNGMTTGDYKLVDDDGLELNFSISNDGVSNNIRDNTGIAKIGTVVSGAVAKLIITIQTGGYAPRVFLVILFILIILGILYYVRNKATSKVKE